MTRKAKKGSQRKHQKAGLNRSILDVGWSGLTQAIRYKLEEGEGVFMEVPTKPVKPSQTCPKCLHQKKKDLSERLHYCEKCGYTQDRDIAAAEVMVLWATNSGAFGTSVLKRGDSSSTFSPTRKECGGMKQLGSLKRSKHHPTGAGSQTPPSIT